MFSREKMRSIHSQELLIVSKRHSIQMFLFYICTKPVVFPEGFRRTDSPRIVVKNLLKCVR